MLIKELDDKEFCFFLRNLQEDKTRRKNKTNKTKLNLSSKKVRKRKKVIMIYNNVKDHLLGSSFFSLLGRKQINMNWYEVENKLYTDK
jgi:hypothetical protein